MATQTSQTGTAISHKQTGTQGMGSKELTPQIRLFGPGWWPLVSEGRNLEDTRASHVPLFMAVNSRARRVMGLCRSLLLSL